MRQGLTSIAFPSISTGAYGYPIDGVSRIALGTVKEMVEAGKTSLQRVVLVTFSSSDYATYQETYRELFY